MSFVPSALLQKYLKEIPVERKSVIGAIIGYIYADPGFVTSEFDCVVDFVLQNGMGKDILFEQMKVLPGDEFNNDKLWDDRYYAEAIVNLKDNFCRERIEHVKRVAMKIYARKEANEDSYLQKKQRTKKIESGFSKREYVLAAGLTVVVAIVSYWLLGNK